MRGNIPKKVHVHNKHLEEFMKTKALCDEITKNIEEDKDTPIYPSTIIFFGAIVFVIAFLFTIYLLGNRKKLIPRDEEGNLDQEDGTGIKLPKVVEANGNSQRETISGASSSGSTSGVNSNVESKARYYDNDGVEIFPTPEELSRYSVREY